MRALRTLSRRSALVFAAFGFAVGFAAEGVGTAVLVSTAGFFLGKTLHSTTMTFATGTEQ